MSQKKKVVRKVEVEKLEKSLKVNLSDKELLAYGIELADAQDKTDRLNDELTEVKSRFKSEIDETESKINNITSKIRSKYEYRNVECEKTLDFKKGIVIIRRMDTVEDIEVRDMLDCERQAEIAECKEKK